MQKATNLNFEKTRKSDSLTGEAPLPLLLEFEDLKLTSIYPRATLLFAEGQPADRVYLLRSGRAKVSISSAEGKKVILRVEQAGAWLGVNSVLKAEAYDATVETMERCRVDFVPRREFLKRLNQSETARVAMAHALSNELSDLVEHLRSLLLSQSASEKLARLLLKWCDEQGEAGPQAVRVKPGLTHEEIAQIICVSRETVTRLFAELRRKQILSFAANAIFVRDLNGLESLVYDRELSRLSSGL